MIFKDLTRLDWVFYANKSISSFLRTIVRIFFRGAELLFKMLFTSVLIIFFDILQLITVQHLLQR